MAFCQFSSKTFILLKSALNQIKREQKSENVSNLGLNGKQPKAWSKLDFDTLLLVPNVFFYLKIIKGTLYRLLLWWQADGELSDLIQLVLYIHLCFRIKMFLLCDLCEMFFALGIKMKIKKEKLYIFQGCGCRRASCPAYRAWLAGETLC